MQLAGMKIITSLKAEDHALIRTFCGCFSDMDHLEEELHAENRPLPKPAINIAETATAYRLELALPGYRKSDLQAGIENDTLIIQGRASCVPAQYEEVQRFYKREFAVESFARSFLLPEDVDKASACFEEGILFIHLTKGGLRRLPVEGPPYKETITIH